MDYREFISLQSEKFNRIPKFYAFSNKQFEEGKKELGVLNDNELYSIGGGGYIRKSDSHLLKDWNIKYDKEFTDLKKDDEFLFSAFLYELGNMEYIISGDDEEIFSMLDIDIHNATKREINIFLKALKEYNSSCDEY